MLVPSSSPARLTYEFTPRARALNPYRSEELSPFDLGARNASEGPFSHLLNFFHSQASTSTPNEAAHFYRILDLVHVPSHFTGTERWYNPRSARNDGATTSMRPPYNKLSRLRAPGRVNINTTFDPLVWRAVCSGFPPMDSNAFWDKVAKSREGYDGQPATNFPTRFANPFRAALSADLMPLAQLQPLGAEATLLRSDPDDHDRPLFVVDPATHPEVLEPRRNQRRNAYFHYQGLQRLGNLLTTHSNVFAVWITVGYFEVETRSIDSQHPTGYQLSQEVGLDTGDVERHRSFFIIDRSIPVAYEPGKNHNVDRAILLRRFIE